MTPWLQDADCTLYYGDVLQVLRELPAESVDCCVTSPPYWGLRDYGTGAWEGGDEGCDHRQLVGGNRNQGRDRAASGGTFHDSPNIEPALGIPYATTCGKCGATRIDQQLGLEPTPDCGRRGLYRLRGDLSADQRAFVLQRLMEVEGLHDA